MDPLFHNLPPAASSFPPAASAFPPAASAYPQQVSTFPVPVPIFPNATPFPPTQVPVGEALPTSTFPPVQADPNPTVNSGLSGHPSYPQMITEAIETLKERDGSSRQAIAKYIERMYSNLPATHSALLTQHLKRMKDSGQLDMVKHSYRIAGSAPEVFDNVSESLPKKSPGRPPKLKPVMNAAQGQQPVVQQPSVNSNVPESVFASIGLVDGLADPGSVSKRRPGRPRKVIAAGDGVVAQPVSEGAGIVTGGQPVTEGAVSGPDGQPVAEVAVSDTVGSQPVKRRGRPPRNGSINVGTVQARGRGRPKQPYTGKPRGRPRRNVEAPAPLNAVSGGPELVSGDYLGDGAAPPVGKKRGRPGRPPRSVNEPKKPRQVSGNPPGRPRKNPPPVQVSNLQQLLAYQELKSKLEFFQSRIKHTVGILKPFLDAQTASTAKGALQELEELSTIDITAASSLHGAQLLPPNQV